MITLHHLTLGYGNRILLQHVDSTVERGTLTALIGRNGSGKSTLLRAIAGLERPRAGSVEVAGVDMQGAPAPKRARLVAFVATRRVRADRMTCREVVSLGRSPYTGWSGSLCGTDRRVVDAALDIVGLQPFAGRCLDSLSDGEAQRVMIARAIAQDTPVVLLDEPTAPLDLPARFALCRLLRQLVQEDGKTVVFSTHELELARHFADVVAVVDPPHLHMLQHDSTELDKVVSHLFNTSAL